MPTTQIVAHVIPWMSMETEQEIDHLVECHGFDTDYFCDGRDAPEFFRGLNWRQRQQWHEEDHDPQNPDLALSGGHPHVHDKEGRYADRR